MQGRKINACGLTVPLCPVCIICYKAYSKCLISCFDPSCLVLGLRLSVNQDKLVQPGIHTDPDILQDPLALSQQVIRMSSPLVMRKSTLCYSVSL
jgi:hypothetical protein